MPRIDDFKNTLEIAIEAFKEKNPQVISKNSGAVFQNETKGAFLELPFINRKIKITWPEGEVITPEGTKELSLQEQGLIMHYLIQASGPLWLTPGSPSGKSHPGNSIIRPLPKGPKIRWFKPLVKILGFSLNWEQEWGESNGKKGMSPFAFRFSQGSPFV